MDNLRFRWVPDEDFDYSDYADEIKEDLDNRNDWTVEGCILETKCECCGQWKTVDSLWGILDADLAYRAVVESEMLDCYESSKAWHAKRALQ